MINILRPIFGFAAKRVFSIFDRQPSPARGAQAALPSRVIVPHAAVARSAVLGHPDDVT
jgi:hypothetical protein